MVCLGLQGSFGFCYSDLFRHSPFGFRHFPAFDIRHSSSINSIDMDSRLAVDSTVLLLYFVLIISIGLYMGRKEENLKDRSEERRVGKEGRGKRRQEQLREELGE